MPAMLAMSAPNEDGEMASSLDLRWFMAYNPIGQFLTVTKWTWRHLIDFVSTTQLPNQPTPGPHLMRTFKRPLTAHQLSFLEKFISTIIHGHHPNYNIKPVLPDFVAVVQDAQD
jgi:hypothetical protein